MLSTDPTVLQIAFLPDGSFVLPVLGRLQGSKSARVRALAKQWAPSGLGDLACSLSTKISMLDLLAEQVNQSVGPLFDEISHDPQAVAARDERKTWAPRRRNQPYRVLLALDALIFELRSTYEILGKFLVIFADVILGRKLTQREIISELESRGTDMTWARELQEHRKLFFHEQAPWIAVRVVAWHPLKAEILLLTHSGADPGNPAEVLAVDQLRSMHRGIANAIANLQTFLLERVTDLENEEHGATSG
jgi:hypothetical protein